MSYIAASGAASDRIAARERAKKKKKRTCCQLVDCVRASVRVKDIASKNGMAFKWDVCQLNRTSSHLQL